MKNFIKSVIITVFLLAVLVIGGLGYLGFIPFVSKLMGSDVPRDLGIKYSAADRESYVKKSQAKVIEVDSLPIAGRTIDYSGKIEQKESFTDEEVTARVNASEWEYFPFKNTQIKFNEDGSMEFSGVLQTDKIKGFISSVGGLDYSSPEIEKGMAFVNSMGVNPPFYAKITPEAKDNKWTVSAQEMQLGRLPVPLETIRADQSLTVLTNHINNMLPNMYVRSFSIEDGKMNVDATVPNELKVLK